MVDTEKPELVFAFDPAIPAINDNAAAVLLRILQQHAEARNDSDVQSNTGYERVDNDAA
jgi:hypothetical protein